MISFQLPRTLCVLRRNSTCSRVPNASMSSPIVRASAKSAFSTGEYQTSPPASQLGSSISGMSALSIPGNVSGRGSASSLPSSL